MKLDLPKKIKYPVYVEEGFDKLGGVVAGAFRPRKVAIVTDDMVGDLYSEAVADAFPGSEIAKITFPHGEKSKNQETYLYILKKFEEFGLTRADGVVALGGGVTGDLAGFAAATYMRGVKLLQCPTTLLAMTDSSVGGKTGIDFDGRKNLVGAFYDPALVYIATDVLDTLPEEEIANGLGEVAKCALLTGDKAFDRLIGGRLTKEDYKTLTAECVRYKAEIVAADPYETGERRLLNLGHTIGHAVESASGFTLPHGVCVARGIRAIIDISANFYGLTTDEVAEMKKYIGSIDDPAEPISADELKKYFSLDKKSDGGTIEVVLLKGPGRPERVKFTVNELARLLNEI